MLGGGERLEDRYWINLGVPSEAERGRFRDECAKTLYKEQDRVEITTSSSLKQLQSTYLPTVACHPVLSGSTIVTKQACVPLRRLAQRLITQLRDQLGTDVSMA